MEARRATAEQRRERTELDARFGKTAPDARFGKIGISAVAAALRYASETKNPAYAPAVLRARSEADEAVA